MYCNNLKSVFDNLSDISKYLDLFGWLWTYVTILLSGNIQRKSKTFGGMAYRRLLEVKCGDWPLEMICI